MRPVRCAYCFVVVAVAALAASAALGQSTPSRPDRRTSLTVSSFRTYEPGPGCRNYQGAGRHGGKAAVSITDAERDNETVHCLRLTYDVTGPGDGQLPDAQALAQGLELPGNVDAIKIELLSDGSGNRVACVLVDRTGERLFYHLAELDKPGWITAEAKLNFPEAHWDGNNNGTPEYPLRLGSIVVTARPGAGKSAGEILIDKIEALCDFATEGVVPLCALDDPKQPPWRIIGSRYDAAELTSADDPQNAGAKVAKLSFGMAALPAKTEVYVGIACDLATPLDRPGTILLDVFGDNCREMLFFGVTDAGGDAWYGWYPPLLVDWTGWRTVYLFSGGTTWEHSSDVEPERAGRYPLKLTGIQLAPMPADGVPSKLKGQVLLRQLRFAPGTPDVLATCRKAVTDIRAVPTAR